jgi:regulator of Ty1 transposition protein 103
MSFSEKAYDEKLKTLSCTQGSIQTVAHWMLFHKAEHERVVQVWLRAMLAVATPSERRLALMYLMNDVAQSAKRRGSGTEYIATFARVLPDAVAAACFNATSETVAAVAKTLKVLEERGVFSSAVVSECRAKISAATPAAAPSQPAGGGAAATAAAAVHPILTMERKVLQCSTEAEQCMAKATAYRGEIFTGTLLPTAQTKGDMTELACEFEDAIQAYEALRAALRVGLESREALAKALADAAQANATAVTRDAATLDRVEKTLAGVDAMKQRMKALYERLPVEVDQQQQQPSKDEPEQKKQKTATATTTTTTPSAAAEVSSKEDPLPPDVEPTTPPH